MKIVQKLAILFAASILVTGCGGGDGGPSEPEPKPDPRAATLIFPDNNSECTEGTILSDTESTVNFQWSAAENTDSYTLRLRNLDTDITQQLNSNTNELAVRLTRGTPYSWSVISKANGTSVTAESTTWRFYNAGPGITNYSPFPADDPSPKSGASVNAGTITLSWVGSDLDNDIVSYEIVMDTSNPPVTSQGTTEQMNFEVQVNAGSTYYWQVITNDAAGNSSLSEVFQFKGI
jgi:hypothetical protein